MRGALLVPFLTAALGFSSAARADGPGEGREAQAEDLFQRAKAAMARSDYKSACPMLAESYRLVPGGGTLQNLAVCYEEEGKIAFAYNRFNELRASAKKADREDRVKLAEEHIAKLGPRISRLRLVVPEASRTPGLTIKVDGEEYGEASWNAGIALNTGTHVVIASAPGKRPLELRRKLDDEGVTDSLELPKLVDAPRSASQAPPNAQAGASLADLDRVSANRALRTTGFVVGGIGLATAALGGVFGVLTLTTNNAAKSACRDNTGGVLSTKVDPSGKVYDTGAEFDERGVCYGQTPAYRTANDLHDRANTYGTVSTILVPVGLVGLALGSYFVFTSSKDSARSPSTRAFVMPTLGGATLVGEFQ